MRSKFTLRRVFSTARSLGKVSHALKILPEVKLLRIESYFTMRTLTLQSLFFFL